MSKTTELLKAVKEIISSYCPHSFFWRAKQGYPKIEYTLQSLDVSFADKYVLTLHLYDKDTMSAIEELADRLDDEVGLATYQTENFYFKFYKQNDRQIIDEQDKTIAHLMMHYEIILYWRNEINEFIP